MIALSRREITRLIKELKAKKNQLDERLMALEVMDKWLAEMEEPEESARQDLQTTPDLEEGLYGDMHLKDLCFKVVSNTDELWTSPQVTEKAKRAGYIFKTARPEASVATTLRRLAQDGKIRMIKTNRGTFFKQLDKDSEGLHEQDLKEQYLIEEIEKGEL